MEVGVESALSVLLRRGAQQEPVKNLNQRSSLWVHRVWLFRWVRLFLAVLQLKKKKRIQMNSVRIICNVRLVIVVLFDGGGGGVGVLCFFDGSDVRD